MTSCHPQIGDRVTVTRISGVNGILGRGNVLCGILVAADEYTWTVLRKGAEQTYQANGVRVEKA